MICRAQRSVLLIDGSKFERPALSVIAAMRTLAGTCAFSVRRCAIQNSHATVLRTARHRSAPLGERQVNRPRNSILPDERRRMIGQLLRQNGSVSVTALEAEFGISSMTARRDLDELERRGVARRTHGGAVL